MKNFEFAIIASGQDIEDDGFLDALWAAGCDDATISLQKGALIAEFNREAISFSSAIASACQQLEMAGATVTRIEPDHLVTLSEIAERCELSRAAISLYTKGKRLAGFPSPTAKVTSKHPLWDWYQVADWLCANSFVDQETVVRARIVRQANMMINSSQIAHGDFAERLARFEAAA